MLAPDPPPPPTLELPWPSLSEGRRLLILAAAPGGRSESLGRFLGAAFIAFGLLLLLVGSQKALPPALAAGGACIFAGLGLLAAVRRVAAPVLILDGENGAAVLCRHRLGRRAFRIFPLAGLECAASPDGRRITVRPRATDGAGREIPGLPSGISDRQWREGMTLPTSPGDAQEALEALRLWEERARQGETPPIADACDSAEFSALLGKRLPGPLLQSLSWPGATGLQGGPETAADDESPLRPPSPPHPEIRRAPDLRESSGRRDKRD